MAEVTWTISTKLRKCSVYNSIAVLWRSKRWSKCIYERM